MTSQSRTVRVFLSSTFRDFAEERDLLVRKVFPELRRKCRERQVELVDVDLRWGITEKEAQQGKVLPICLAEIDRSRPYFMGFIGERYGWVPEKQQYDPSLIIEQPWLDEHRGGKSVTELEMLHGVLNNPEMAGRAFFYFRNSACSRKKGGPYLSEGTEEKAKLQALKDRIRKSRFPVVENYRSPENLAERVRDDLWKLIDESFPESEVPDLLARERMRHEAYGVTRRRLYLGGERYLKALNKAMKAKPFRTVLVSGQSGGGKSALLANWVVKWAKRHPKALVIVHHLGCGADASDPVRMATRLMEEIARATGDEFKPESDPDKQLEQLPQWLAIASAWAKRQRKDFLFVLDGLDKISDHKHLGWFPRYLPPRIKLVASCLHGEVLEASQKRLEWRELRVKPFTKTEQKRFIKEYLGRYRKSLTAQQAQMLQSHPLSGNPLFLLTVLEELRVFGVHEKLEDRLKILLSPPPGKAKGEAPTVDDVFEHVLARIEEDLGQKSVQAAMEAIWASRSGLLQDELLGIAKLAPSRWAAIQNALDESIYESGGKINFGHDHLRKAVEDRYRISGKRKYDLHDLLANWFAAKPKGGRIAHELPWQYMHANNLVALKQFLADLQNFVMLLRSDGGIHDAARYWKKLGGESSASGYAEINLVRAGHACTVASFCLVLDFFAFCGWYELGLATLRKRLPHINIASDTKEAERIYLHLATFLIKNGKYDQACEVIQRRRRASRSEATMDLLEAEICRLLDDPKYAIASAHKAIRHLEKSGRLDGREYQASRLDFAKLVFSCQDHRAWGHELLDLCLAEIELRFGSADPLTIEARRSVALALLEADAILEAETVARAAYSSAAELFGSESIQFHQCGIVLGYIMTTLGEDIAKGWRKLRNSTNFVERYCGSESIEVSDALEFCGYARTQEARYAEGVGFAGRALLIRRAVLPPEHPKVLRATYNLACYECLSGNTEGAKRLIAEHVRLHPETKDQAQADPNFESIRDFIATL